MSPIDREIVRRKLETITSALALLEPIRGMSLEVYRLDPYRRKAVERLLQEIVEAAVDINAHVLVRLGRPAPDDLHSSFLEMGGAGVIEPALAAQIAPSAGLRNRLVHAYDRIDDAKVLAAVGDTLAQYPRYVEEVERFVAGRGP